MLNRFSGLDVCDNGGCQIERGLWGDATFASNLDRLEELSERPPELKKRVPVCHTLDNSICILLDPVPSDHTW